MLRSTKRWRAVLLTLAALAGLVGSGWLYYRWEYPYGWSHSCDKQLMFALHQYAEDHGGAYSAGEVKPETSLRLLYPQDAKEKVFQGKNVPIDMGKGTLERVKRLRPDNLVVHFR